jgi:hypothetical protein
VHGITHAVLALLDLDFGRASDADAASELDEVGSTIGRAGQFAKRDGGFAPHVFPKKTKGNPEEQKSCSNKKKDTAEKSPPAGDTALTAWIDRSLVAFG